LELRHGKLDDAERALRDGLNVVPNDPRLLAALARVAAARRQWRDVVRYATRAGNGADIATLGIAGDAEVALGDTAAARVWYARVARLAEQRPEPFNRQWTQFRLDHHRDIPAVRALLETEIRTRPDVYGWDLLAWARYLDGDVSGASDASARALRMGTRDAVLFYHAGVIAAASGRTDDAERLFGDARNTNPYVRRD